MAARTHAGSTLDHIDLTFSDVTTLYTGSIETTDHSVHIQYFRTLKMAEESDL